MSMAISRTSLMSIALVGYTSCTLQALPGEQLFKNTKQWLFNTKLFALHLWHTYKTNTYKQPAKLQQTPTPESVATQLRNTLEKNGTADQFLLGASTSEHQCSHHCTPEICSWSRFAQEHDLPQPTDTQYPMDLWEHYKKYIDYMKDTLHFNAFRFSIEWALVQPNGPDTYDQETLHHYADLFTYAIKKDITPITCFHHYTDPCWFIDSGGFEQEENIQYFTNFCVTMYESLITALAHDKEALKVYHTMAPRQPLFSTFNSPEGYAFKGYRQMDSPPADPKKKGLRWTMTVLKNILEAHVHTYNALKEKHKDLNFDTIASPAIGFLKNIHQLDPAQQTWIQKVCSPLTRVICTIGNMLQNEYIYQFFTTGTFNAYIPGILNVHHTNTDAPQSLDFIGLNYYSNRHMFLTQSLPENNPDKQTDNTNYRIYPQGLYRAIAELSQRMALLLHIPIYVTENGIATRDNKKRHAFYLAAIQALYNAVKDQYPVHGYTPWTLADNYEWPSATHTNNKRRLYGLCSIDADNNAQLILKPGSQSYINFVQKFFAPKA